MKPHEIGQQSDDEEADNQKLPFDEDDDDINNTYEYNPKPSKARNSQNYRNIESPPPPTQLQQSHFQPPPSKISLPSTTKKSHQKKPAIEKNLNDFEELLNNLGTPLDKIHHNIITPSNTSPSKVPKRPIKKKKNDNAQSRPKMIHTQKTRVNIDDGKRKTKTLITRTTSEQIDSSSNQERNRARTKNVNYHYMLPDKLPNATFPSEIALNEILNIKNEKLLEQEKEASDSEDASIVGYSFDLTKRNYNKYNSDIVNDLEEILRSPIKGHQSTSSLNHMDTILERTEIRDDTYDDVEDEEYQQDEQPESEIIRYNPRPKRNLNKHKTISKLSASATKHDDKVPIRKSNHTNRISNNSRYHDKVTIKEEENINEDYDDDYDKGNRNDRIMTKNMTPNNVPDANSNNTSSNSLYKCEMCSAVFKDRSQLLVHVPVHI